MLCVQRSMRLFETRKPVRISEASFLLQLIFILSGRLRLSRWYVSFKMNSYIYEWIVIWMNESYMNEWIVIWMNSYNAIKLLFGSKHSIIDEVSGNTWLKDGSSIELVIIQLLICKVPEIYEDCDFM